MDSPGCDALSPRAVARTVAVPFPANLLAPQESL
jgi:hypothetical protein